MALDDVEVILEVEDAPAATVESQTSTLVSEMEAALQQGRRSPHLLPPGPQLRRPGRAAAQLCRCFRQIGGLNVSYFLLLALVPHQSCIVRRRMDSLGTNP